MDAVVELVVAVPLPPHGGQAPISDAGRHAQVAGDAAVASSASSAKPFVGMENNNTNIK